MSDKETPREENNVPTPPAEEPAARNAADDARRPADQCHGRYVEWFRQSLAAEGEVAYQRWGMPLFHSLAPEEIEAQTAALGLDVTDALDFYNRGCLLASREDYAGAVKAFDRAIQLDANLSEAVFNRALALEKSGDIAAARQGWQQYLDRFGETEDADDVNDVKDHLGELAGA